MDQGNSNPNNKIGDVPSPSSNPGGGLADITPDPPSSFGMNSPTTPMTPPASNFEQSGTFSQPMSPPVTNPGAPPTFIADNSFGATPASAPEPSPIQPATASELPVNPLPASDPGNPIASAGLNTPDTGQVLPVNMGPSLGNQMPVSTAEANPFGPPAPQAGQDLAMAPTAFNPFSSPETGSTPPTPPQSSEAIPTDLSNLVDNPPEATSYMPQADATAAIQPEPLIVAPSTSSGNEVTQAVSASGSSGGFPKILIIIGGIILLGVIAASAYFILGIGKPAESVPTPVSQQPIPTPIVTASPTPEIPVSTQSGSFSNLPGATVSATPAAGGTAYDRLLRNRQSTSSAINP